MPIRFGPQGTTDAVGLFPVDEFHSNQNGNDPAVDRSQVNGCGLREVFGIRLVDAGIRSLAEVRAEFDAIGFAVGHSRSASQSRDR